MATAPRRHSRPSTLGGDVSDITLAMAPAAMMSGRLTTADGSPRPNALFQVAALLTAQFLPEKGTVPFTFGDMPASAEGPI